MIKQTPAWFLSQFYDDPLHQNPLPICGGYGSAVPGFHCPEGSDWGLVLMYTSPPQIEASKQDPRVVYCGTSYSKPPAKLLEVYAPMLDPEETYTMMGQILAKLAESEPLYMH